MLKMWHLVRLLYENRIALAISACNEDSEEKYDERLKELALKRLEDMGGLSISQEQRTDFIKKVLSDIEAEMGPLKHVFIEEGFREYNKEAHVKRADFKDLYLTSKGIEPNIYKIQVEEEKERNRTIAIEFDSVLESCIDASSGYIKLDDNGKKIYLTALGKKFAAKDGLVKGLGNELSEILGSWKLVVLTVITTVGILKIGWFFTLITGVLCKLAPTSVWCIS